MKYGRICCMTIHPGETIWTIVYVYQMQNNINILLNIYSQSQFSHQIKYGKMSYEPIEYPNKKIIKSKNFQWKLDLYHWQ